jgi:hypothetical protein
MKYSKLMKERIRRVRILFRELGHDIIEGDRSEESFSAAYENDEGFLGGFFIDADNKFLEIAFTFSFSHELGPFIQQRLEEMLRVCYEFGCYLNVQNSTNEIEFSVYSKIYYAGLNYYALKETLRDFQACVESIKEVIDIQTDAEDETS